MPRLHGAIGFKHFMFKDATKLPNTLKLIMWGCFSCSVWSIKHTGVSVVVQSTASLPPSDVFVSQRPVITSLAVSPCSGCCYHSAVSGGSCSACSSASSPCGNRRSWGPSGYQGNGPVEACSETSSQMDWRGGRDMRNHYTNIISHENKSTSRLGKKKKKQTETTTERVTLQETQTERLRTRSPTCNKSKANRSRAHSSGQRHGNHITWWNGCNPWWMLYLSPVNYYKWHTF